MEVPESILAIAIGTATHFLAEDIEVLVDGHGVVGIAGRDEVGHGATGNTQRTEHLVNKILIVVFEWRSNCQDLTGGSNSGVDPALAVLDGFGSVAQVVLEDL